MTKVTLAAITAAQWLLLFPGSSVSNFAFAYAMKVTSPTTDNAVVTSLVANVNNIDAWKLQTPAEVEIRWYPDGVSFKTILAGDYKIVYQLPS